MIDVTIDRDKYIGGSDVPAIMGVSKFTTRNELLKQKLNCVLNNGNEYTEYGHVMESKIREYLSEKYNTKFEPGKIIQGYYRYHDDCYDGKEIIEIKTTSRDISSLNDCLDYLYQTLFGMALRGLKTSKIAIYKRPLDFDTEFKEENLKIFEVKADKKIQKKIFEECDKFWEDLEKLKQNPFETVDDLMPIEIKEYTEQVLALEERLKEYDKIKKESEQVKEKLIEALEKNNLTGWDMINGTKITLVPASVSIRKDVDKEKLKADGLLEKYEIEKETKRKAYLRITINE